VKDEKSFGVNIDYW